MTGDLEQGKPTPREFGNADKEISSKGLPVWGNAEGLVLGLATIKAGKANARHRRPKAEEMLHLVKGSLKRSLGTGTIIMDTGDTIAIASGVFHNASHISD